MGSISGKGLVWYTYGSKTDEGVKSGVFPELMSIRPWPLVHCVPGWETIATDQYQNKNEKSYSEADFNHVIRQQSKLLTLEINS